MYYTPPAPPLNTTFLLFMNLQIGRGFSASCMAGPAFEGSSAHLSTPRLG